MRLEDGEGHTIVPGSEDSLEDTRVAVRRTTVSARLKAIYGTVDRVDAFVGLVAERHVPGSDLGVLQQAIWKRQFEALRDRDRFFYRRDRVLRRIERRFGVSYRHSLADLIAMDAGVARAELPKSVFFAPPSD